MPVTSGIPQGSVLGPIMFLIYVNDLPEVVSSTVKLFADDTKLYRVIKNEEDKLQLQEDLNNLQKWSEKWQLPFNVEKCKVLHLGPHNEDYNYTLKSGTNLRPLEVVTSEKDLGIIFDKTLHFTEHIEKCSSEANRRIGLILRNFKYMDEKLFIVLYKALIRPVLEYGNVVWKPYFKKDSELLERVQRRATKIVKSVRNESYPVRLPSLVYRIKRADMIQLYRIMTGIDNLQSSKFIKMEKGITRGHIFKAFKPRSSSRIKRNTLGYRAINEWNTLSHSVVSSENINQFKTRLESFWETQELKI